MIIQKRALGVVKEILEEAGYELSYAYDDLVFADNTAFLIQFDEKNHELNLFFNKDCYNNKILGIEEQLKKSFNKKGFYVDFKGFFTLVEKENEELELKFST